MRGHWWVWVLGFCGFWATPALALTLTALQNEQGHPVLVMGEGDTVVLSHIMTPDAAAAAAYLERWRGRSLRQTQATTDRYGQAQAVLTPEGERISLQEQLLAEGLALFYPTATLPARTRWQAAEARARSARRGWWATDGVHSADGLAAAPGTFVVLEGRLARSYKSRDTLYLNFGEDWRTDTSLKIPRAAWRRFGENFTVPDGTRLRARGAVQEENGPMLVITRPEQLEILRANP